MAKTARTLPPSTEVCEADALRANLYRMLAHVLRAPPQQTDLDLLAGMSGDGTPLGRAARSLARIAARGTPQSVDREYHELFIGIDGGELVPYGSHYRSGVLHEPPLSRLEGGGAKPGIQRVTDIGEEEDHIAALCEMMAGLIRGQFGEPAPVEEQKAFFNAHLGVWARRFFTDLEGARRSIFYAAVGKLGSVFMDIEEAAFELE